jgi:prepilin-type N-terminal cleavage/methylation domain-containing protein
MVKFYQIWDPLVNVALHAGESGLGNRVWNDCLQHEARPNSGFTLIELLVAIAIIAVLGAVLLPALAGAKSRAICTACQNNLHQIGIALNLYVDDNRVYPDFFTPVGRQLPTYPTGLGWDTRLLPYVSSNCSVFICRARKSSALWTNILVFNPSYGYNIWGTGSGYAPLGLGKPACPACNVLSPADMIAIGDYPGDDSPPPTINVDLADGDLAFDDAEDYVANRHFGGGNIVFCDVHVEYGSQTNWMRPLENARARWNYDHQPHRETWQ